MRYIISITIVALVIIGFVLLINDAPSEDYQRNDPYSERYDEYDCSDFTYQWEAQEVFEEAGGPEEDYYNLDRNGDGVACESLL